MNPAELRKTITIQNPVQEVNAVGFASQTWNEFKTVAAKVIAKGATEVEVGGKPQMQVKYEVLIRFGPNVQQNHRILFEGKLLSITGVADVDGKRKYLTIWCTEGQAT